MADTVDIGPRLESLVTDLVKSGRFKTGTEVIRAGLRMIEEREQKLGVLDAELEVGLADADAGLLVTSAELQARLVSKYNQMSRVPRDK